MAAEADRRGRSSPSERGEFVHGFSGQRRHESSKGHSVLTGDMVSNIGKWFRHRPLVAGLLVVGLAIAVSVAVVVDRAMRADRAREQTRVLLSAGTEEAIKSKAEELLSIDASLGVSVILESQTKAWGAIRDSREFADYRLPPSGWIRQGVLDAFARIGSKAYVPLLRAVDVSDAVFSVLAVDILCAVYEDPKLPRVINIDQAVLLAMQEDESLPAETRKLASNAVQRLRALKLIGGTAGGIRRLKFDS